MIFSHNILVFENLCFTAAITMFLTAAVFILLNAGYDKKQYADPLINTNCISIFLEFLIILSVIVLEINSAVSLIFLSAAMFDGVYITAALTVTLHLKKKFNKL